ncbi:MAG: SRPBCC family protein [Actinomycetota bacterium]
MRTSTRRNHTSIPDAVARISTKVSTERIYGALADIRRHGVWGGSMHKGKFGLSSVQAPVGAASVGTEFDSTGNDLGGTFTDHSVVTEAARPHLFEFVTEGHLTPKKGAKWEGDTTIIHRYEIAEDGDGRTLSYRGHVARWTNPPWMLTLGLVRPLMRVMINKGARKTLRNLVASADQH